jgi:drug/metabolite transporter (DMT)-like permease
MGVLFGLATALSWGTEDYLAAVASRRAGALVALLGLHLTSVIFLGVWVVGSGASELPPGDGLALVGIGFVGGLGYLCFLRAMVVAPVSIVSAIVSGYSVVILLWALVLLDEVPAMGQSFGTALTLGGVVLSCVRGSELRRAQGALPGLVLSLCATLTLGSWIFAIEHYGKSVGIVLALLVGRLSATVLLLTIAAFRLRSGAFSLRTLPAAVVIAGLLDTLGYVFFQLGTRHGQTGVVAVASSVYFLVPVGLAVWLLRERPARTQWLGFLFIVVGLLLLGSAA